MYFLLSPAKNLNESHEFTPKFYSTPPLLNHAAELMHTLRQLAPQQIAELMHVSDKIAPAASPKNTSATSTTTSASYQGYTASCARWI